MIDDGPDRQLNPYRRLRLAVGNRLRRRLAMRPRTVTRGVQIANFGIPQTVAAYFPDPPGNIYQIDQWLAPLERLDESHPVVLICRSGASFSLLKDLTRLPIVFVRTVGDLDNLVAMSDLKLVLYVNHAASNFQMLRYHGMFHVHVNHGESEKGSMSSHQIQAYDYAFVAGARAIARYEAEFLEFSEEQRSRMIQIGRPQLDFVPPAASAGGLPTILYAPTWEADRPSMRFSSVGALGVEVATAILESGRYRLVYRPHPRTGSYLADVRAADARIRELIEEAADADPEAGHVVDTESPLAEQIGEAVLGISDISAVTFDIIGASKPVILTRVADELAPPESAPVLEASYRLGPGDDVLAVVAEALGEDPKRGARQRLAADYFGDMPPGAATKAFLEACDTLIERRDTLVGARPGSD